MATSKASRWRLPIQADGDFQDFGTEKAFVMLNLYAGFDMASGFADDGRSSTALQVLESLRDNVVLWNEVHEDADIADDLIYVGLFIDNLLAGGTVVSELLVPNPWPSD